MIERSSGILMPISSLPSPHGIGTMGKAAYDFADFLAAAGQKYWQLLPLGPTSYGDSPYQSFSSFAGNPYFIDLDLLVKDKLLTRAEVNACDWGDDPRYVDYGKIYASRFTLLEKAKTRGFTRDREAVAAFERENERWLPNYALFMALKRHFGMKSWTEWDDEDIRCRTSSEVVERYRAELREDVELFTYIQFLFFRQWEALKAYIHSLGIRIIGDLPIYVAMDSADVWAEPEMFQLDEHNVPTEVSGVPPDCFSEDGQLWGNPLYNYEAMAKDGFGWWIRRIGGAQKLYDVIRIDHFIGIVKYYTIPADMPDARQGEYCMGPGKKLTDVINRAIGDKKIIAEDLGVLVPEVNELLEENNYPGMKVLEFAFGGDRKNPHLPHNYTQNCVVYGGTHDNETLMGYFIEHPDWELGYAYDYLDTRDKERMVDQVFRAAYGSVANLVIFAVQDILKLGNWARMNTPSTLGTNWKWRVKKGELNDSHIKDMRYLASVFGRENS